LGLLLSLGGSDRQPVAGCLVRLDRDETSAPQAGFETCQDALNQGDDLGGAQALQALLVGGLAPPDFHDVRALMPEVA